MPGGVGGQWRKPLPTRLTPLTTNPERIEFLYRVLYMKNVEHNYTILRRNS